MSETKPYHPSQDGGRKLADAYLDAGYDFRLELGAHRCVFEDDACVLGGHGVVVPVHGGRLEELTQAEQQVVDEHYGSLGVAAVRLLLGLRYGALPEVDPALPGVVYPLVQPAPDAIPTYKWQGSYRDPAVGTSRTTYGPGFATKAYADRYLKSAQARAAAERREVGRPEYDRWRLLLVVPQVRVELVEER